MAKVPLDALESSLCAPKDACPQLETPPKRKVPAQLLWILSSVEHVSSSLTGDNYLPPELRIPLTTWALSLWPRAAGE